MMIPLSQIDLDFSRVCDLGKLTCEGVGRSGEALADSGAVTPPPILSGGLDWHKPGVNFVGLDWLTFSFPMDRVIPFCKYLAELFGSPEIKEFGRFSYQAQAVWSSLGVGVYFDKTIDYAEKYHRGKACVVLPGKFWALFDGPSVFQIVKTIVFDFWGTASRIDVNFDDYDRVQTPSDLIPICETGSFSGFRSWSPDQRYKLTHDGSELVGDMITFGRRGKSGGGKYLRCYDKNLESGGEKNCIRWELELSQEKAKGVLLQLASSESLGEFGGRLAGLIGACITFLDRSSSDGHISRMTVLPWWEKIVSRLGCVFFVGAERVSTVEKSRDWIENQVATSLALVRRALCNFEFREWLEETILSGDLRLKAHHKSVIKLYHDQHLYDAVCF